MSSSDSVASASDAPPLRTTTWQVVHAQDFSQACSMAMPLASKASQMDVPGFASNWTPSGHRDSWGNTESFVI